MKTRWLLLLLQSVLITYSVSAQKWGYMDMEFVTSKMPEYQKAQTELDKFSDRWAKEIQDKYAEVDRLQRLYQAEEVLLTDEMKRKRNQEISDKEREAREYNNKIFGFEGMLFQKKKELIKPVTDQVYKAVERVCRQRRLDMLVDKSSEFVIIYSNPVHDYTDYVMEELGLSTDSKNNKDAAATVNTPTNKPSPTDNPKSTPNNKTTNKKQ
ncbi:MAG: OmpH family outer membrane protein [Spirosomaceae bacterium]|jgi:outer membrane protein|nr:OmpH family outer membrane protein [Spirosomataceae bacterium]